MTDFDPVAIFAGIQRELAPVFAEMEWAEDEITQAQHRHPEQADLLYHGFPLLHAQVPLVAKTEFAYRAHARELLERLAAGQDTRPGTDAELACTLSEASMSGPLTTQATALYMRVWLRTFPEKDVFETEAMGAYEYVAHGVDELENEARRKLTVADRQVRKDCEGLHHGDPAPNCPQIP